MKYTLAKLTDVTFENDSPDSAKMLADDVVRTLKDREPCAYVAIGDDGTILVTIEVHKPSSAASQYDWDGYHAPGALDGSTK